MKKQKLIFAIVSSHVLVIFFTIGFLIVRIVNNDYWDERYFIGFYYFSIIVTGWRATSIFCMMYTPVAIIACIGLILRRNWGRISSIILMATTILISVYYLFYHSCLFSEFHVYYILINMIIPIILGIAVLSASIFSLFYLNKSVMKKYFEKS